MRANLVRKLFLAVTTVCCLLTVGEAQTTHRVGASDVTADYTTIQGAIDAASSGDTIHVIESPHTEYGITINKDLTIKGDGAAHTIIQGHAERDTAGGRLFIITTASTVIFEAMTLQHGRTTAANYGGAIRITGAAQTTIQRCHVKDNNAYRSGGGVFIGNVSGATLTVLDSTFSGNVTDYGSAQAAYGGAIYTGEIEQLLVRNCTFFDNLASSLWSYGGAINAIPAEGKYAWIQNSTFVNNRSYRAGANTGGGAINGSHPARVIVESCVFQGNQANTSDYGTCMYRVSFTNTVYHNTVGWYTDLGGNTLASDAKVATVLTDNGGPTLTLALLENSPAIDTGSNPGGLSYDQRGRGFHREGFGVADAGAFEVQAPAASTFLIVR